MEIESAGEQTEGETQLSSMWPTFVALSFMPGFAWGSRDVENKEDSCPHSHMVHKVIISV